MGKHSAGDEGTFWRSVVLTIFKWVGLAVIPIAAGLTVWMWVNARDEAPLPSPSPTTASSPTPTEGPSPTPQPSPSPAPAISPGTRVQVLDGSSVEGSGTDARTKLEAAGLRVIGPSNAARDFPQTTVFYQPGHLGLAQQIADLLGASKVEPAPDTVDEQIPVTVVTGDDYQVG